jgi:hypothetical protein
MFYSKQINIKKEYDLIVCGGGMSGFSAAVAASRKGLKTAIIERMGCLGGVATSCGVNHFLAGRKYDEETGKMYRTVGGIFDELTDTLITRGAAVDPDTIDINFNPHGWYPRMAAGIPFDAEQLKVLMDDMCLEAGIDIYYFTNLIDTVVEDNKIKSLIVNNKSGLFALAAKVVVDASGDGDVAYFSGCKTVKGREEDGLMTPASLEFYVEKVDTQKYVEYQNQHQSPKLVEIIERLKKTGEWTFPYEIFIAIKTNEPDVYMVNTIRQVGIDGTDGDSVTRGMIEGRKENLKLFNIMKKYFPGFEKSRIRKISEVIGIRETRRIVGAYVVTIEDALSGKKFGDCIASTTYNFDLPDPKKPSYDPMMGHAANPNARRKHSVIEIPYRALLPQPVKNLIMAGRCVSVEREVLGPVRIMGPCMGMGQAAGTASALAVQRGISYDAVDSTELRKILLDDGCLLP